MYILTPVSKECEEWIEENVHVKPWQYLRNNIAVDHHHIEDLFNALTDGGFVYNEDFTILNC